MDSTARLVRLAETLNQMAGVPTPSHLFQAIAEAAPALVRCDWLGLCIADAADFQIHPLYEDLSVAGLEGAWSRDEGLVGACLSGRALRSGSLQQHPRSGGPEARLAEAGIRSALLAPIGRDESILGALYFAARQVDAFDEEDLRIVTLLADGLARGLESARLFEHLGNERSLLGTVLNSVRDGILVVNTQGVVALANPAVTRMLEVDGAELVGRPAAQYPRLREIVDGLDPAAGDAAQELELPGGGTGQACVVSVADEYGTTIGKATVIRDISLLKHVETIRTELLRALSHDLRTPLSTLDLAAGMLGRADAMEPRYRSACEQIVKAVDYMDELVSKLADLGHMASDDPIVEQLGDLADLARDVVDVLRPRAVDKAQTLELELTEAVPFTGDLAKLRRVLFNLVANALKYTPEGGRVVVSVSRRASDVVIAVADNGMGIPEDDLPRLFDRHFRVDSPETRRQSGAGLGLAIVRHIVEAHGGRIDVTSRLGEGSVFTVTLPQANRG